MGATNRGGGGFKKIAPYTNPMDQDLPHSLLFLILAGGWKGGSCWLRGYRKGVEGEGEKRKRG